MPQHTAVHQIARRMARWVCCWWLLALGVAMASPMVRPQAMELVCSSAGVVKLVQKAGDAEDSAAPRLAGHTLDCPLCMASGAPPPVLSGEPLAPPPWLRHVLHGQASAPWVATAAAPLPARGPPQV
ncbi:DUF2946 domain-containing protein [Variovorax sp. HJSM1_2]|uniref:DUF2946 domain-containing protein n=1 Tax=Variovorax sp. HJSM1_2 TaxID=3366263 RepID=UPI003BD4E824